jgi:hypothetical protein
MNPLVREHSENAAVLPVRGLRIPRDKMLEGWGRTAIAAEQAAASRHPVRPV